MLLQKLLDAGAYTLAGDVIWHHPVRHNLLMAHWKGGPTCVLTDDGEKHLDELLGGTPEILDPVAPPAPMKRHARMKKAEPAESGLDLRDLLDE